MTNINLKRVFIFIAILLNLNWQSMKYKVLDWSSANELKKKMNGKVFMNIEFNLSCVYILEDSSYLIIPLNPFGNSLLTSDKALLEDWVKNQHFPVIDEANKFYFKNQSKIDNLLIYKEELKKDLYKYALGDVKQNINTPSEDDIDSIYQILKRRKKIKEYKLNFVVLIGDFLLNKNKNWKWGVLRSKQLLNPLMSLIIVKDEKQNLYFNLEDNISGKWGYPGVQYVLKAISESGKKANEIEEIAKVM
jgi:hypothetical protein